MLISASTGAESGVSGNQLVARFQDRADRELGHRQDDGVIGRDNLHQFPMLPGLVQLRRGRVARVPRRDNFLADLCRPGLDESLAVGAQRIELATRLYRGILAVFKLAHHFDLRILRGQLVEQRAGPFFQQFPAHVIDPLGDLVALLQPRLVVFGLLDRRQGLADLLIETIDLRLILGDPLRIEPTLQGDILLVRRAGAGGKIRLVARLLALGARDLRVETGDLILQLLHVGAAEGRVEPGQNLALDDTVALLDVNALDDRIVVQRLKDIGFDRRDNLAAGAGDDAIHLGEQRKDNGQQIAAARTWMVIRIA